MNRKKTAIAFLCAFSAALTLFGAAKLIGTGAAQAGSAKAAKAATAEATFETEPQYAASYAVGQTIKIENSTIAYDGKSYTAVPIVYAPDGTTYAAGDLTLSDAGVYTVEYRALADGKVLSLTKEFQAVSALYSVGSSTSSAFYGSNGSYDGAEGIVVRLAAGDTFTYQKMLDLSGATQNDGLLSMYFTPQSLGYVDATEIVLTLTDAYDADNALRIRLHKVGTVDSKTAWTEVYTYVQAGGTDQTLTGLEPWSNSWTSTDKYFYKGRAYRCHRGDEYGTNVVYSLSGIPGYPQIDESAVGRQSLTFSYDAAEKTVWCNGNFVVDLDDPQLFPSTTWKGFTTGECYLSVSCSGYSQKTCNFVITDVANLTAAEAAGNCILDAEPPTITPDYRIEDLPKAKIGKAYLLPTASASDACDGAVPTTTEVWYNYGSDSATNISVKDGSFTPTRAGTYTILFSASDRFGNRSQLLLELQAIRDDSVMGITPMGETASGKVGEVVSVRRLSYAHASGAVSLKIYATSSDGLYNYEIPSEGENAFTFQPYHAGRYAITYEATDYFDTVFATDEVEISADGAPVFDSSISLPRYLIKGCVYTLPTVGGYVFENGEPVWTEAQISLKDDNGSERKLKGKKITSYADEYTTISYYLENEYGKTERTVNIPVVDTGYGDKLNLSAYFHGDSFTAEPSDNYTTYTTDTDGAQLDFINQLVSTDFSLIFTVGKANFKNVDIYLIDCNDENVYLKLTYTKNGTDGSLFRLNDGESFVATADFYSVAVDKFTVNYDNATQKIVYTTGSSLTVATDGAGNPFYGFSGSTFYLSIRLTEVSGRSSINIYSVNKQKINTSKVDLIEPAILAKNASGERSLNDTFTIAGCVAVDVLDPNVTFTFDVTSPSGEYVRSEEGTLLDGSASPENTYVVKLTQRGVYTVTYTATDTTGRETVYSYIVRVVDMQTPTARLTGSYQTTAKVGDTVTIADIEYADDISERGKMTVFVCAILPDNSSRAVKNNTFTAEQKGKYTVWYMVSDENGNAVFVSYTITVS